MLRRCLPWLSFEAPGFKALSCWCEQAIGSGEGDVAFQARLKQAEADSALLQDLLQQGAAAHQVTTWAWGVWMRVRGGGGGGV